MSVIQALADNYLWAIAHQQHSKEEIEDLYITAEKGWLIKFQLK
jgi:hypothetical protein